MSNASSIAPMGGPGSSLASFLAFAAVGVVGFVVDAGVLRLLVVGAGLSPFTARLGSYLAAATTTWALNRNFTFRARRSADLLREWLRFLATNAAGGLVNYLVYSLLVGTVPFFAHNLTLAVAMGSLAGLVINYSCSARFVFRER